MADKRTIAIVEDDDGYRTALTRLLRAAGYNPVGYSSAEDFLDDPVHEQIRCLVLDVRLGGMSGIELQQQLAASHLVPSVIFVSGHERPDTSELRKQPGYIAFIPKPITGSLLLEAVRRAIKLANQDANSQ